MEINRKILKNAPISENKPNQTTIDALRSKTEPLTQDEFDKFAETLPISNENLKQEILDALHEDAIPEEDFTIKEEFEESLNNELLDFIEDKEDISAIEKAEQEGVFYSNEQVTKILGFDLFDKEIK